MALNVGSRLGHYDVTALIGEGGMGQVYQATDTKLNRQAGRMHQVKELLGHGTIATTDTYLNAGRIHLHESMLRLEAERGVCTKFAQNSQSHPRSILPVEDSGEPKSLVN